MLCQVPFVAVSDQGSWREQVRRPRIAVLAENVHLVSRYQVPGMSEWARLPLTYRCALARCSTTTINDKCAQGEISFSKNGQELGVAFDVPADSRAEQFFPAVAFKNAQVSRRWCCTLRMRPRGERRRGLP